MLAGRVTGSPQPCTVCATARPMQREDDGDPRDRGEELDRDRVHVLQARLRGLERAEQEGRDQHPADAVACDRDERERDEPLAGRDVAAEVADRADGDRGAAEPRAEPRAASTARARVRRTFTPFAAAAAPDRRRTASTSSPNRVRERRTRHDHRERRP